MYAKRAWPLAGEDKCILDFHLNLMRKLPLKRSMAVMETITGNHEREVMQATVLLNKPTQVWIDVVTGTVYKMNGNCMTSSTRRIIEIKEKNDGRTKPA